MKVSSTQTELEERAKQLTIRIVKLAGGFPSDPKSREVGTDLLESVRSLGVNYRSAIRAETHNDFVEKVEEAANDAAEAIRHLDSCRAGELIGDSLLNDLLNEASQLRDTLITISTKTKSELRT